MNTKRRQQTRLYWALLVIGLLLLATALIRRPLLADALPQSAYQQLQEVWQRAGASAQYDYQSTILQTTIPTARLSNAGRSSQTQRIRIDGNLDKPADLMQMALQIGQREPVAIKIEDGQAYGRQGNGDETRKIGRAQGIAVALMPGNIGRDDDKQGNQARDENHGAGYCIGALHFGSGCRRGDRRASG